MRYIFIMLALIVTCSGASANPGKLLPPTLIAGPADVQAGTAYTYSYTDAFIVAPSWNITAGTATINSTWSSGSTYYASVTWTTSGTLHFFDDVVIVNKTKAVSAIALPGVTGAQHCGPATLTLTATYASPASGVRWYTASTGGTLLSSTTTYQPALTTTTTYYVEAWNSALTTSRVAVTATIHAVPDVPDDVTGDSRCGAGSVTLSATADAPGNTVLWYTAPVGGDTVYSGTTYVIPSLSNSVAYYAAGYKKSTGCVSATRLEVTADVLTGPPLLVAWGYPVRYGSGEADLKAYAYTRRYDPEQPGSEIDTADYDVLWYATPEDAEDDVSRLANTPVFTTPPITSTTTYYVRLRDEETDCRGDIIPVVAEVIPYVSNVSVRTDAVRVTGKKTELSLASATDAEMSTTLSYLDGAGRVQQNVVLRGSPSGKDVVAPYEYDKTGRTSKQYLPYIASTTNGSFHSGYAAEQASFYLASGDKIADDSAAFVKTVFQESPLGLVLEQGTAGKGFQPGQGHSSVMEYVFNTSGDYVRRFDAKGNSSGYYAAKTLTKTKTIGPDGNYTLTFTDGSGNTVLVRQWIDASIESTYTDYLETYYIYSTLGQVNFIVSPKGTAELKASSWTFSSTIKDSYCNQFKYDNKGRVIEKKVPGQAWQYIIYDPLGRVVLTQDGLLRPDNKWMFIKYDYPGHAVMTGIHTNTTYATRATMQSYADGLYVSGHATYGENSWFEKQETTLEGYTNVSFPKDDIDVLSVNYFDDYDFDNTGGAASYVSAGLTGEHTPAAYSFGRATGSKRKILGTGTWLKTYVFYDDRGRTIQVQTTNSINTGNVDRVTNAYADDGRLLYSKKHHDGGAYVILNKYEYTARGDLWKVSQDNGGTGSAYQLVAQYEYNELGQLVDKKLHDTGSGAFLQSVDYRYTIRGQLKSINNSELSGNSSNDDTDTDYGDYFGMELLYNETESGLTTNNRYDGSITAMKWKRIGAASGTAGQQSYAFTYDKTGRLENAGYALKESAWDKELGAQNETMTYDHNGNILTLQRKQRKYDDLTASYTNETIDNLTYAYKSADKNSLEKVTDAASTSAAAGFDNGSSSTSNDYTYDANGNLLSDTNKGIDSIKYNFLGKPVRMKFSDGKVITYVYDAGGNKLTQKLYHGDTLKNTTDYVNGFVYENGALSFFGSPEGRVINNGGTLQYEYAIADHQGNTRVVFTSDAPSANAVAVNFESATNSDVLNYTRTNFELFDHTDVSGSTYTYSQKLTGATGSQVGVAKTLKVYPGDKVKIEAYAKYYNPTGTSSNITGFAAALTGAFGVTSSSTGEALKAYNTLNNYGGIIAGGGSGGSGSYPKLFVNILLFDKDYNFLDAAWEQIDGGEQVGASPKAAHDLMSKEVTVKEAGFAYVFISNENPTLVEFYVDDVVITHTPTNVIQYNEYYPFGLQTSASWTRESSKENQSLYNAGSELNKTNGWYEMYYRGYDPAIGRMLQVDPYATMYASQTTYNYAVNNPVMINDPNGGQAMEYQPGMSPMGVRRYNRIAAMGEAGDYYSEWYDDFSFFRATGGYDVILSVTQAYSVSRSNFGWFLAGAASSSMELNYLTGLATTDWHGITDPKYAIAALDHRSLNRIETAWLELNAPFETGEVENQQDGPKKPGPMDLLSEQSFNFQNIGTTNWRATRVRGIYFTIVDGETGKTYENFFSLEIGVPKKGKDGTTYSRKEAIDKAALVANAVATQTAFVSRFIGPAGREMILNSATLPYYFAVQMQLKMNNYIPGSTVTANTYSYSVKDSKAVYVNMFKGLLERLD